MRFLHTTILLASLSSLSGRLKPGQLPPCTGQGDGTFVYYSKVVNGIPMTQCAVLGDGLYIDTNQQPAKAFVTMASLSYIQGEQPAGAIDGSNNIFTTLYTPILNTLILTMNGQPMTNGTDYTLSGNGIAFVIPPPIGATLVAFYRYSGGPGPLAQAVPNGMINYLNVPASVANNFATGPKRFYAMPEWRPLP